MPLLSELCTRALHRRRVQFGTPVPATTTVRRSTVRGLQDRSGVIADPRVCHTCARVGKPIVRAPEIPRHRKDDRRAAPFAMCWEFGAVSAGNIPSPCLAFRLATCR